MERAGEDGGDKLRPFQVPRGWLVASGQTRAAQHDGTCWLQSHRHRGWTNKTSNKHRQKHRRWQSHTDTQSVDLRSGWSVILTRDKNSETNVLTDPWIYWLMKSQNNLLLIIYHGYLGLISHAPHASPQRQPPVSSDCNHWSCEPSDVLRTRETTTLSNL